MHSKKPFYVYGHYTTSGELFYIGKGSGLRAWTKKNRTKEWKAFAAQGYEVRIIRRFETAESALKHEEELHIKYGLRAKGGRLVNQLIGGATPIKLVELWKAKIAEKARGNKHTLGRKLTQEHRRKISDGLRGRKVSQETRQKLASRPISDEYRAKLREVFRNIPPERKAKWRKAISLANKGKIYSEETRKRISRSKTNPSKETRERLSNAASNRTPEHKAKIGSTHRGKIISDEQKEKIRKSLLKGAKTRAVKISKAIKGRPKSEEWKKKMSEAMRKYWSKNPKRSVSDETRRKLSLASKKIKRTPGWRKRISEANKGRVFSEEHRINIAKARQRFIQSNRLEK